MSKHNQQFIIHLQITPSSSEVEVPLFAANLEEAIQWADKAYTSSSIEVVRIRPKVDNSTTGL